MALIRTDHAVSVSAAFLGTASHTTGAYTIPANSLIIVKVLAMRGGADFFIAGDLTLSDSSGLTWTTRITNFPQGGGSSTFWGSRVFSAVSAAGGSLTFTADAGAIDIERYVVEIFSYTGFDAGSPIGTLLDSGYDTGGEAASITLPSAPATTSEVLGFADINTFTGSLVDVGSGFAEIHDGYAGSALGYQSQFRTASASTNVPWADLSNAGGGGTYQAGLMSAIEIKAAESVSRRYPSMDGGMNEMKGM